ncbi:MAG: HEAT repeat domain-containing protein [Pseudomonadota bacterium]|nr:HEAT repeat domain-containing protein [Pseudomonadota bacterium]
MTSLLKTYLERIKDEHRKLDARGVMQMQRQVDMALDDIYVTLNARIKRESTGGMPLVRGILSSDWTLHDQTNRIIEFPTEATSEEGGLDIEALYARNRHWVILGDPGSGKTTLLRHQAWKAADDHLEGRGAVVPVYLTLRYFDPKPPYIVDSALLGYGTGRNLEDLGFGLAQRRGLSEEIEQALTEGRGLILCDGLDEQRDASVKKRTAAAIESLAHKHPDNRCMVTSRIVGYDAAPLKRGFQTATLEPFSDEQVRTFFRKWYRAVEKAEDLIEAYTEARADRKADEMTEAVLSEGNPGLRRLAANPLLCTIIGLIHRQGGALPEQRVELYKLCVDTFIFNWEMHKRRRKEEQSGLNPQETQEVLEPIAFHLQEETVDNRAPRETILGWAARFLVHEHGIPEREARAKAGRLLDLIRDVAGLFIERGAEEYAFFHLSFQEYLCARYITRRRREIEAHLKRRRDSSDRQPHLFDPRWREVIYLAAAYQGQRSDEDASELVELVARQTDLMPHEAEMQYAFRMAFACLRETRVLFQTADERMGRWVRMYLELPHLRGRLLALLRRPGHPLRYKPETLDTLFKAVGDKDTGMRRVAVEALGALKDPRALDPLLHTLRDKDASVRWATTEALSEMQDPRAVDPLLRALRDEDDAVQWQAAWALGRLQDPRALEPLLQALRDKDAGVQRNASWALGQLKDPRAFEPLLQNLRDNDPGLRKVAAYVFGNWEDRRALEPLIQALRDKDPDVRQAAAGALGMFKDPQALEPLLQALRDEDIGVRQAAIAALGALQDPQALNPLFQSLHDQNTGVRQAAAGALYELQDPQALEPLLQALRDKDADVRGGAASALGALQDPRAIEPLLQAILDKDAGVRRSAAWALGELQDPQALEPLLQALRDKDASVRDSAAWALAELQDPQAVEPLLQTLRDHDASVRRAAAEALGELKDHRALDYLLQGLRDKDFGVREAAADAIEGIELGGLL